MRQIFLSVIAMAAVAALSCAEAAGRSRGPDVEALYDQLAKAGSSEEAMEITTRIERAETQSGSDTVDLLMERALKALRTSEHDVARRLLDDIISIAPDFPEAWHRRAKLHFVQNRYDASMLDLAETLKRRPRHLGAWLGLAAILQETDHKKLAYEAFKRAQALSPKTQSIGDLLEKLREEVEGRPI